MDEKTLEHLSAHTRRARDDFSETTDFAALRHPHAASKDRIACLKVLALTLLREIESLENATGSGPDFDLSAETRRFESEIIRSALIKTGGRQRQAARLLGMKVTTLNTKIRRQGIKVDEAPVVEGETSS